MEPFRFHVFVCDQQKPEGVPCCAARGSGPVMDALRREINARGLADEVQVTECGSLGLCEHGPNLVVYPEGIWYSGLTPADVPEIVRSHFEEDTPVERLVRYRCRRSARGDPAQSGQDAGGAPRPGSRRRPARRPDRVLRGFQESRAILTALELDLFTAVGDGADARQVAATLHSRPARHRDASERAGVPPPARQAGRDLSQLARHGALLRRRLARQRPARFAAHRSPVAPLVHPY